MYVITSSRTVFSEVKGTDIAIGKFENYMFANGIIYVMYLSMVKHLYNIEIQCM